MSNTPYVMSVTIWEGMAGCYWKSAHGRPCVIQKEWETNTNGWQTNKHKRMHRCIQYQCKSALHVSECAAGSYQNGCAGARSEHRAGGRRSCTWGIWKASPRSAVWCGAAGFPSGWRRPRIECSGMASHLGEKRHAMKNEPATWHLHILFIAVKDLLL